MAIGMATESAPADLKGISMIADGINHAIPTHREMQTSLGWLIDKGFVTIQEKKYNLTLKGRREYETASEKTNTLFKILENLKLSLKTYA